MHPIFQLLCITITTYVNFVIAVGKSQLIIRQGLTSNHSALEVLRWDNPFTFPILKNYVVPMTSGFYVSFNGFFGAESRLALVYTAYSHLSTTF